MGSISTLWCWIRTPAGKLPDEVIGEWSPGTITIDWNVLETAISSLQAKELAGVQFEYKRGDHALEISRVTLIADDREVATDEHLGFAGVPSEKIIFRLQLPADATTNSECKLRVIVRGKGGSDSFGAIRLLAKR